MKVSLLEQSKACLTCKMTDLMKSEFFKNGKQVLGTDLEGPMQHLPAV